MIEWFTSIGLCMFLFRLNFWSTCLVRHSHHTSPSACRVCFNLIHAVIEHYFFRLSYKLNLYIWSYNYSCCFFFVELVVNASKCAQVNDFGWPHITLWSKSNERWVTTLLYHLEKRNDCVIRNLTTERFVCRRAPSQPAHLSLRLFGFLRKCRESSERQEYVSFESMNFIDLFMMNAALYLASCLITLCLQ